MNETTRSDSFEYSFAVLKILFCFFVVLSHYWTSNASGPVSLFLVNNNFFSMAVPVFMFISFYLCERIFTCRNGKTICRRLHRLGFPLIAWALLYFAGFYILGIVFREDLIPSFSDLLWQLGLGSGIKLCPPMWFQSILLLLTLLFMLIGLCGANVYMIILWILMIVSIFLQYKQINYSLFINTPTEMATSLGRFAEMLPYAVLGCTFSRFDLLNKLRRSGIPGCLILWILTVISFILAPRLSLPGGFMYQGISLLVRTVLIVSAMYTLPFGRLPGKIKKAVSFVSGYCFGIYCMHYGIGKVLGLGLRSINLDACAYTFFFCIIVFVISLITSWLISLIPSRFARQLVK